MDDFADVMQNNRLRGLVYCR